jgi:glyoxylase-like metal-dependent hydrolase (beta-lactamase superfamily II)
MKRALAPLFAFIAFALASCATGPSREQGLIDRGIAALGGADALAGIKTVSAKGTIKQWEPEQSDVPGGAARFANEGTFEYAADRASRSSRTDWVKNFSYPSTRTFTFSEIVTPEAGYVLGVDSNGRTARSMKATPPAHSMSGVRLATSQRELRRLSPGALLLEMRANPQAVRAAPDVVAGGRSYPALSYGGFVVAFDAQTGLPARVRTLDYDYVWGDVNYDLVLDGWQDFGGVKVAMRQKYEMNGALIGEQTLNEVRFNAPIDAARLAIPAEVRAAAAKPATGNVPYQWVIRRQIIGVYLDSENVSYDAASGGGLKMQELAPGVQHVVGGTHNNLVVEMSDHLIVFDAPVSDAQSKWVIDAAKAKYPGKPIRYLVLTHHHMDHTGGLRAFLAEGATLVVGQGAAQHFRKVLASPTTRNPDLAARDFSGAQIIEVADQRVFSDGKRAVSVYAVENPHAKSYLMGYVADARLGWVTDLWSPGRDPLPAKITPPLQSVVAAVKKAGIQPVRFAGGHGSNGEFAPLLKLSEQ